MATASIRRSEAGRDGMVNIGESLVNAVKWNMPKVLCREAKGINQKVRGPEQGF